MNILLVNPPSENGKNVVRSYSAGFGSVEISYTENICILPPVELLSIATIVRNSGEAVFFKDYQVEYFSKYIFLKYIEENLIDIVILNISFVTYLYDSEIARLCKSSMRYVKVFLMNNVLYNDFLIKLLHMSQCDAIITRESVVNIMEIIKDHKGYSNVIYLEDGVINDFNVKYIENIDDLPIPSRDLLNNNLYKFHLGQQECIANITTQHTSYGCEYPCAYYCPYPLNEGNKYRAHSVTRVVDEMASIKSLGIDIIIIRDPLFSFDRQRIINICDMLILRKINIKWWCETRITCLDGDLLKIMKSSGCIGIEVGVESGDDTVMKKQGKPGLNRNKLLEFRKISQDIGIHVQYLFLVGLPMETTKSVFKTFKLILDMELSMREYKLGIITPWPGTPIYQEALDKNWLSASWEEYTGYTVVMKTDNISFEQMKQIDVFIDELYQLIDKKDNTCSDEWIVEKEELLMRINLFSTQT